MSNYFKISGYAVCAFICLFAAISCGQDEELPAAEVELAQTEIEVSLSGGKYGVAVNIENAVPGTDPEILCGADWITALEYDGRSTVSFVVSPSDDGMFREASIEIVYPFGYSRAVLRVMQGDRVSDDFRINLTEIYETQVYSEIVPVEFTGKYLALTVKKSIYDELGSDEALLEDVISSLSQGGALSGSALMEYLDGQGWLFSGPSAPMFVNLDVGCGYYLFAVGLDDDAEQCTGLTKKLFSTLEVQMVEAGFEFDYEINGTDVLMTVTPEDPNLRYSTGAISVKDLESTGMSMHEYMQYSMNESISYALTLGMSMEEAVDGMSTVGPDTHLMSLNPDEEYIAYAYAITSEGVICSDIVEEHFVTGTLVASDNVFDVNILELASDRAVVEIIPSNYDPYFVFVEPARDYEGMTDDEVFESLLINASQMAPNKGRLEGNAGGLQPERGYVVFVFGVSSGQATTPLTKEYFTTPAEDDPAGLTFEFVIEDITDSEAELRIVPDPHNAPFMSGVTEADASAEDVYAIVEEQVEMYQEYGMTRAEYVQACALRGNVSMSLSGLVASTSYKVWSFGVYMETGDYATDVVFSEVFTTDPIEQSDIEIAVTHDAYFDGAEVAEEWPSYSGAEGMALLPVSVEVEGQGAADWYFHIYMGDLTSEDMSDEVIINELTANGIKSRPACLMTCAYEHDLTVLAVARDWQGRYSRVYREKINLSRDGAAPVDDFVPQNILQASVNSAVKQNRNIEIEFKQYQL